MTVTKEDIELGRRLGLTILEVEKAISDANRSFENAAHAPPNFDKWRDDSEGASTLPERIAECRRTDLPGRPFKY